MGMNEFPDFMKQAANQIATGSHATQGAEGYVFDGADRSQMAFWTCRETAASAAHVHDFDEYMVGVEGCYTLIVDGQKIAVKAGEEHFHPAWGAAFRGSSGRNQDHSRVWRAASAARSRHAAQLDRQN